MNLWFRVQAFGYRVQGFNRVGDEVGVVVGRDAAAQLRLAIVPWNDANLLRGGSDLSSRGSGFSAFGSGFNGSIQGLVRLVQGLVRLVQGLVASVQGAYIGGFRAYWF